MGNADARPQIPLELRPILPHRPGAGGIEMEELFPKVFLASQQQVHSSRRRAAAAPGAQIIKILPSVPSIHLLEVVSPLSLRAGSASDCVLCLCQCRHHSECLETLKSSVSICQIVFPSGIPHLVSQGACVGFRGR